MFGKKIAFGLDTLHIALIFGLIFIGAFFMRFILAEDDCTKAISMIENNPCFKYNNQTGQVRSCLVYNGEPRSDSVINKLTTIEPERIPQTEAQKERARSSNETK